MREKSSSATAERDYQQQLRDMNEALLVSSLRQHELTEQAQERERALRESEERYRTLFDLGPVAVYSCDASGAIRDFNRIAAELWGRRPKPGDTDERFCGSFESYLPDGTIVPHDRRPMAEVLSGAIPEARDIEVQIGRPDGSRITVIVNIRPLKDERGDITGAIECFVDITERKRAEDALRLSEERFRGMVESSHDCIKELDLEGRLLSVNRTGQCLLEIDDLNSVLNAPWPGFWKGADSDNARQAVATARAGGVGAFEGFCATNHGTPKWWSVVVTPIVDSSGEPARLMAVSRDITERKRAEEALRDSEALYRTLFDSMDEGFCVIELLFDENDTPQDYRYLEVNPAFEKQSGLTRVVGKTIKQMVPGIERYWIETFGRVASTGTPVHVENYAAEMERWFDVNALRVGEPAGRRVVCLFTDISARKFAEAALVQEKARTENILTSITDAFLTLDRDWRFTYFNARATEIFETANAPADVLGKNLWDVFPDLVGSILEREYHRAMDERVSVTFELHYQLELWLEITAYPSADGISVLFRNITGRKEAERRAEFLLDLARKLSSAIAEADIVSITVEAVGTHLEVDRCYFVENPENEDRLILRYNWLRGPSSSIAGEYDLGDFGGAEWWSQCAGGDFAANDVTTHPLTRAHSASYAELDLRSYAVQPFRREGKWTVVLVITESVPRKWTAYDLGILDDAAARAWPMVERARGDAALRESEARFRALVTASSDAIYRMSPDWGEMGHLVGRDFIADTHAPGRTWLQDHIHPDDRPHVVAAIAAAIRTRSVFELEHRVMRVDGTLGWTFSRAIPVLDARGEIVEWFGAASDITERKRAEEALRESEDQRRLALDGAELGSWHLDPATMTLTTDERLRTIFGTTEELDEYEQAVAIIHPDDRERMRAAVAAATRPDDPAPYAIEYRVIHPDGAIRWVFAKGRANFRHGESGRVLASFDGTAADITERTLLEHKTHAQALALTDQGHRKDEFLAMLAHELRNPLAPITNAVQLLRLQPNEDPIQRQARTIIERQVAQLTRLVDDLMEVSRITTGRVQLRLERVAANGIVERAVESALPLIGRHNHELAVSPSPEPIWLYADAARLEQVVVNLLTNAAKYTADGGHISLSVLQEGGECVLRLRDTGVGIALELLPRIFDLFTQAERSLDRSQGGLGIGLALVQRLVELHRGRVEVISALGHGSEFVVYLPALPSDAPQAASTSAEATLPTGPSLRVLVVDDNVDAAETLAMLLQMSGHDVRTAHDGPTGLEAAIAYGPHVVLLDIGLPELDGFQVAQRIRQHPDHEKTVLVAMTGYGQEEDRRRSREAGFDHHLVKPADFDKVREILATVKTTSERGV